MSAASVAERTATMSGAPIGGMAATRQVSASHVPPQYGGQAVIEGVMMRGRQGMAVAVRQPSGRVVVHSELLEGVAYRSAWVRWPFVRGALLLGHSLTLGIRALVYSANVAVDGAGGRATADGGPGPAESGSEPAPTRTCAREPQELQEPWEAAAEQAFGGPLLWGTMVVSLAFAVGLFFVLPVLL